MTGGAGDNPRKHEIDARNRIARVIAQSNRAKGMGLAFWQIRWLACAVVEEVGAENMRGGDDDEKD